MCRLPNEILLVIIKHLRQPLPAHGDHDICWKQLHQDDLTRMMRVSKVSLCHHEIDQMSELTVKSVQNLTASVLYREVVVGDWIGLLRGLSKSKVTASESRTSPSLTSLQHNEAVNLGFHNETARDALPRSASLSSLSVPPMSPAESTVSPEDVVEGTGSGNLAGPNDDVTQVDRATPEVLTKRLTKLELLGIIEAIHFVSLPAVRPDDFEEIRSATLTFTAPLAPNLQRFSMRSSREHVESIVLFYQSSTSSWELEDLRYPDTFGMMCKLAQFPATLTMDICRARLRSDQYCRSSALTAHLPLNITHDDTGMIGSYDSTGTTDMCLVVVHNNVWNVQPEYFVDLQSRSWTDGMYYALDRFVRYLPKDSRLFEQTTLSICVDRSRHKSFGHIPILDYGEAILEGLRSRVPASWRDKITMHWADERGPCQACGRVYQSFADTLRAPPKFGVNESSRGISQLSFDSVRLASVLSPPPSISSSPPSDESTD